MIHKFKNSGMNILLDVNSGGVHVIDDMTYDLLDYCEPPVAGECPALGWKYPAEELKECWDEL